MVSKFGKDVQIVGDDLTVTNPTKIARAVDEKAANALLLKVTSPALSQTPPYVHASDPPTPSSSKSTSEPHHLATISLPSHHLTTISPS